ncbi:MAG: EpsI family protein [Bryobacteraceae bacterium]|nr:EpsI family protein [Bryobacteraceae bacterium]MDW8380375.1 EpsI family protein [Bryobacterales bacterium]
MLKLFSSPPARALTVFLVLQAVAFYALGRSEPVRQINPLTTFPQDLGDWKMVQEGVVEKEVMEVLKADDVVTRWYGSRRHGALASLFIAYFATQRSGKAPHSPKNCLPGNGWVPVVSDQIQIRVPGRESKLEANRYIVARGNDKSLVIYWYHTRHRTIASEYHAKIFTALDAIRYNRSDTAVVKVTIPLRSDQTQEQVTEIAEDFIRSFYPQLEPFFPA